MSSSIFQTNTTLPEEYDSESNPVSSYDYFVLYSAVIISFISFLGASFIILTYLKFPKLRNFTFKLVTFISLSDFLFYLGKLISISSVWGNPGPIICSIQGLLINYGELASVLWSGTIAFTLYYTIITPIPDLVDKYYFKMKLICFGVPFLFTIIPWYLGYIGQAGDFCWIVIDNRHRWTSFFMRLFEFYLPLWGIIYYNIYVYIRLIHYLNSINANVGLKRLALYPLILVICWFFPTLHRIESFFRDDSQFLNAMHNISESLQGILNAILYGMNENVRFEWKKYLILKDWCLCLFPDAQRFKNNIELFEFEHHSSFLGSDSDRESFGSQKKNSRGQEIELQNKPLKK